MKNTLIVLLLIVVILSSVFVGYTLRTETANNDSIVTDTQTVSLLSTTVSDITNTKTITELSTTTSTSFSDSCLDKFSNNLTLSTILVQTNQTESPPQICVAVTAVYPDLGNSSNPIIANFSDFEFAVIDNESGDLVRAVSDLAIAYPTSGSFYETGQTITVLYTLQLGMPLAYLLVPYSCTLLPISETNNTNIQIPPLLFHVYTRVCRRKLSV